MKSQTIIQEFLQRLQILRIQKSCWPFSRFYFLVLFSNAFLFSLANLRSTFFTSSAGGRSSGTIPRWMSIWRTAALLSTCSLVICVSPCRSLACTFTLVISAAKSLALMLMVGRKSAKGREAGTPILRFITLVLRRKRAWSPLERMTAKLLSLTPRSYNTPDSFFSVSCNLARAFTRSTSNKRCSMSSARRVCTAKYVAYSSFCRMISSSRGSIAQIAGLLFLAFPQAYQI